MPNQYEMCAVNIELMVGNIDDKWNDDRRMRRSINEMVRRLNLGKLCADTYLKAIRGGKWPIGVLMDMNSLNVLQHKGQELGLA